MEGADLERKPGVEFGICVSGINRNVEWAISYMVLKGRFVAGCYQHTDHT